MGLLPHTGYRRRSYCFTRLESIFWSSRKQMTWNTLESEPSQVDFTWDVTENKKKLTLLAIHNLASGLRSIVGSAVDGASRSDAHVFTLVAVVINACSTVETLHGENIPTHPGRNNANWSAMDIKIIKQILIGQRWSKMVEGHLGMFFPLSIDACARNSKKMYKISPQ